MKFSVCEKLSQAGIKVVFLTIKGINNTSLDENLSQRINQFYQHLSKSYSLSKLESENKLLGYRKLHTELDANDKALTPSPESLIRIILKNASLKSINFIVDTYNYVSVKNKISIGAHDLSKINGNVKLSFPNKDATFIPLGSKTSKVINENDYCYMDEQSNVLCHLECKQSEHTKTTINTENCLFIVQGNKSINETELLSTAKELETLIALKAKDNYIVNIEIC